MLTLDHIAIASSDLIEGSNWVEDILGVPLQTGGRHARYGTHNTLLSLGDLYLEVIAVDPDADRHRPTWFDLDNFTGAPRPANWICRTDDLAAAIAAAPVDPGPPVPLSRGDLHWQITVPEDGSLPLQAGFPTLIRWGNDTAHPTASLTDRGCRLIAWEVHHPDADLLARQIRLSDSRVSYHTGAPGFRAVVDTPHGPRTLE